MEQSDGVTQLLARWHQGDQQAYDQLFAVVLEDLRIIARAALARERRNHTLVPTALVNETYLRLMNRNQAPYDGRAQFFGVAAKAVRHILMDYAKARNAEKRGGGQAMITLNDEAYAGQARCLDVDALNQAMERLAQMDERAARVVEMKFFAGMTAAEIAAVLAVSEMTVLRDWKVARRWIHQQLFGEG